jgi:tRNA pseudouridine38-40 synthase
MRTLKLTIQYDGTGFVGWQRQGSGASIQGLIEEALAPIEGGAVTVHGAGRTDAGVHALAQVAHVELSVGHDTATLGRAVNAVLPAAVRVVAVDEVPAGFHARFDATGKVYEYRIVNAPVVSPFLQRYAWHIPQPLDRDAMARAAGALEGEHDFAAFQGAGSTSASTRRTITRIAWTPGHGCDVPLTLRLEGNGFLRYMVRNIVGTLVEVGVGRWSPDRAAAILESRDRMQAGPTAPPHGLFLVRVIY